MAWLVVSWLMVSIKPEELQGGLNARYSESSVETAPTVSTQQYDTSQAIEIDESQWLSEQQQQDGEIATAGVRRVYGKYATQELQDNIEWLYWQCINRGLKPSLVFAVQAKESGWGKSWYCTSQNNCFGYGYTCSGKVGDYDGDDYREVTTRILDMYEKQGYGITNAQTMSNRGYNFHSEWVTGVNEIESYFN